MDYASQAIGESQRYIESLQQLAAQSPTDGPLKTALREQAVTLTISYHNLANEEEFLNNFQKASVYYAKAAKLALQHLGPSHKLTAKFQRDIHVFSERYKQIRQLMGGGPHPRTAKNYQMYTQGKLFTRKVTSKSLFAF